MEVIHCKISINARTRRINQSNKICKDLQQRGGASIVSKFRFNRKLPIYNALNLFFFKWVVGWKPYEKGDEEDKVITFKKRMRRFTDYTMIFRRIGID